MHILPTLDYSLDALEPYISERTMQFHYLKHHQTYLDNLNRLIAGTAFENSSLEDIIRQTAGDPTRIGIFNNSAQAWNHAFFWKSMTPNGGGRPTGILAERIDQSFGSYENFRQKFTESALSVFGSGWLWLVRRPDGQLELLKTSNADNPLSRQLEPILTIDLWEHAYYLDYQNRRAVFVETFLDHLVRYE